MKQLLERLDSDELQLAEVPRPSARDLHLVVDAPAIVVSAGTERMLLEFGRANVLGKARRQPKRVREVLDKACTDGVRAAWQAVRARLQDQFPSDTARPGR